MNITNANGQAQIQQTKEGQIGQTIHAIDVADLPKGVYFLRVQTGEEFVVQRFMKL